MRDCPRPRPSTSGTIHGNYWPSGWPSHAGTLRDADLFTEDYLLPRPLLAAICHPGPRPAVLLIDEVDRADDEFEAFLLELLADAAVTIPELGTRTAVVPPVAVLTSNRTRDLHDALKRRCLYHWIDYPDTARVAAIIRRRLPESAQWLATQVARGVARLRARQELTKPPGIAEAIDWAGALHALGLPVLDADAADRTLGRSSSTPRTWRPCAGPDWRSWSTPRPGPMPDLPELAASFTAALHDAGIAVGPDRTRSFARALTLLAPSTTRELRHCALATLVSDPEQIEPFDAVFREVFGGPADREAQRGQPGDPARSLRDTVPGRVPGTRKATGDGRDREADAQPREAPVPSRPVRSTVSPAATSRSCPPRSWRGSPK